MATIDPLAHLNAALERRYRIERELGEGGMATVYLADDIRHERRVALKVLKPELAAVVGAERFLAEIKTTAHLQHPHILPLFDSGEADGLLFYVMPYVEGESLRERLERENQLSVDDAIHIAAKVAEALDYAHRQGVIHRDIKPANILLHDGIPLVSDFGIARALGAAGGERLTETGLSLGTPHYMSPEQATGDTETDARSDVYSLGATVYEMLAGEPPHTGRTAQAVLAKILSDRPRPLRDHRPRVPLWTADAVDRALSPLPADRFPTAGGFVDAATTPRPPSVSSGLPGAGRLVATALLASVATATVMTALRLRDGGELGASAAPVERPITFTGTASMVSISPDGLTLAYKTPEGLVSRDVRGGRESLLLEDWDPGAAPQPRWRPDGSAVLFSRQRGVADWEVVSVPRLGGDPARVLIASFENGQPVAEFVPFTHDNRLLVMRTLEPVNTQPWLRIYAPPADSYVGIEVDSSAVRLWDATVSPDDRWIAYVAERPDGSTFIATASTDGSDHNIVLEGGQELSKWEEVSSIPDWPWFPTIRWANDDRVYYRRHGGRGMDIYQMRIDLGTGTAAGEPRSFLQGLPAASTFDVSSDGTRLAYVGGVTRAQVHLLRLDLEDGQDLVVDSTLTRGTGWNTLPRVSPDGRRVAFVAKTFETADIFIGERASGDFRRLNALSEWRAIRDLVWSTDGARLLVHVQLHEGGDRLLEVDVADGSVADHGALPGVPVQLGWSPDGRYALYGEADASAYILHDLQTDEKTTMFDEVGGELIFVLFSPDGGQILTQDVATNELWITSVQDGTPRPLGTIFGGPMASLRPRPVHWGADGLIRILDPGSRTLATIPATGGEVRIVARLPASCMHEGGASLTSDATVLLCSVAERETDVWVAEDIDPEG